MSDPHATPRSQRQNAIPTNVIVYKGRKIPARIDAAARIGYIVEIMSNSFGTSEHHITLCLRDEGDNLVTQTNLASKVESQEVLKLAPSPVTEALSVVTSLKAARNARLSTSTAHHPDEHSNVMSLKLALFNLQKYVKEEEFSVELMMRGGISDLVDLLRREEAGLSGNTLAYALQGIRGLLEFEAAWDDLSDAFTDRLLGLVVSAGQPNVLRPATAILRKLVISSQQLDKRSKGKGKARARDRGEEWVTADDTAYFGFSKVWARMQVAQTSADGTIGCAGVLKVITKRLEGAGDLELVAQSLGFINASLRSAQQEDSPYYPELVSLIDLLNVRRYVSRLMPTCANNIVEPQILNFQSRYAAILNMKRLYPVRPTQHPEHEKMLAEIWRAGRLSDVLVEMERVGHQDEITNRAQEGWRRLGFNVADQEEGGAGPLLETVLFQDTGELGLECLHYFASHEESLHNLIIEQEARPRDKQCPIARASDECVKVLCEHYKIAQAGHHTPPTFQLFLLNFSRLHSLVLKFFLRMWADSESRLPDFDRLSFLVHTQTSLTLTDEASKTWLHLEKDFLEADYRSIRERQMEMLEKEDGMLSKPSVKDLREKLGIEAYGVLAEQRVGCMLQGAWFNSSSVIVPGIVPSHKAVAAKPLRYVKLSPNRRTLAWGDFTRRPAVPPAYESLRERIDLSNMTDLRLQTGCPVNTRSPNLISKLSFSIMSGPELSLLDLDAVHAAQLAEWTDGIRVLHGEGGMVSKETGSYVHILAELALKVRLLDITGDGVELPERVSHGLPPRSVDFWFAK